MKKPLITIIVVTYNSEKFILKTLNSILAQDYRNLQIIISDDYSVDNTILLCKEWILQNSSLCDMQLLLSEENRGTAYNINKALPYVKGEYIKIIAGDDEFCDNYFSRCVDYFNANPDASVLTTNVIYVYEGIGKEVLNKPFTSLFQTNKLNVEDMYHTIMRFNVIFSPTCIMKFDVVRELGGFDERYPLCEDLFFYAKVLKSGKRIYFLDSCLIKYRIHNNSVQSKNEIKVYSQYYIDLLRGKRELFWHEYGAFERFLEKIRMIICGKILSKGNDYRVINKFYLLVDNFIIKILQVIRIPYYIKIINI